MTHEEKLARLREVLPDVEDERLREFLDEVEGPRFSVRVRAVGAWWPPSDNVPYRDETLRGTLSLFEDLLHGLPHGESVWIDLRRESP